MSAHEQGEIRHEQCRFGIFADKAWRTDVKTGKDERFAMPLCGWKLPADTPPLLKRLWSGAIDFERDCAVCPCFTPVVP